LEGAVKLLSAWPLVLAVWVCCQPAQAEVPEQYRDLLMKVYNSQTAQAASLDEQVKNLTKTLRQFDDNTTGIQRQLILKQRQADIADLTKRAKQLRAHESIEFPAAKILEQGSIGRPPEIIQRPVATSVSGNQVNAKFSYTTMYLSGPVSSDSTLLIEYLKPQAYRFGQFISMPSLVEVTAPGPNTILTELDWDHASPFWQEFVKSIAAAPKK
jgi:ribosomal protein S15P/S13E